MFRYNCSQSLFFQWAAYADHGPLGPWCEGGWGPHTPTGVLAIEIQPVGPISMWGERGGYPFARILEGRSPSKIQVWLNAKPRGRFRPREPWGGIVASANIARATAQSQPILTKIGGCSSACHESRPPTTAPLLGGSNHYVPLIHRGEPGAAV